MRHCATRRGSALLVVLGMVVFIVTSAVAFSAYMRTQRLPSSFVRRGSASRLALKAGLARAIDEIDRSLGDGSIMPGVGANANQWSGRVYTPQLASEAETVPTLTLEGLAYVPPAYVNEIRYWSRHTTTARKNQKLDFGISQIAYAAMDVSDFLDINRLVAEQPRSSLPNRHIGAAYLFENYRLDGGPHTDVGKAKEWGKFMEKFRAIDKDGRFDYSSKMPFLSLADFNLALYKAEGGGQDGVAGFKSLFCHYCKDGGDKGFFDADPTGTSADTVSKLDRCRRMTLVTDSWFPPGWRERMTGGDEVYDLNNGRYQPFKASALKPSAGPKVTVALNDGLGTAGSGRMQINVPRLGFGALYDYLDEDMVPYSLSLPTTERVAMVAAVRMGGRSGGKLIFKKSVNGGSDGRDGADSKVGEVGKDKVMMQRTVSYSIDLGSLRSIVQSVGCQTLMVYPFNHADGLPEECRKFKLEGCVSLFLATEGGDGKVELPMRTGGDDIVHYNGIIADGEGKVSGPKLTEKAVFSFPLVANSTYKTFCKEGGKQPATLDALERDSLAKFEFTGGHGGDIDFLIRQLGGDAKVLELDYEWEAPKEGASGNPAATDLKRARSLFRPVGRDGKVDETFAKDNEEEFAQALLGGDSVDRKLALCAAVWFKVLNGDDEVVDFVPACMADDAVFIRPKAPPTLLDGAYRKYGGEKYPLMKFKLAEVELKVSEPKGSVSTPCPLAEPKTIMVADPRFNHAPENWFVVADDPNGAIDLEDVWLENNKAEERNGDIFLSVSDQGYLQSIYEMAYVLRFSNQPLNDYLESTEGTDVLGSSQIYGDYPLFPFTVASDDPDGYATGFDGAKDHDYMWNSYRAFKTAAYPTPDDFECFGFSSGLGGYKVNPFSDNTNVLMAAFANTPHNWRVTSTNNIDIAADELEDVEKFNKNHAYNAYSTGSKIAWTDLEKIVGEFMRTMRSGNLDANADWEERYRTLPWGAHAAAADVDNDRQHFLGLEMTKATDILTAADQRFLYGYWHDCFAVRQQLFLIFLRSEPVLMGTGAGNFFSTQLGARAVALVWRDPEAPRDDNGNLLSDGGAYVPHRTRLLFYRQLE